jgi:hypothetical protein
MCCSVIDPIIGRRFGKYGRDFLIHRLKCQNPTIPQLDVIKQADWLIKWGMTLGDPIDPNYQEIAQLQAPPLPSIQGAPPVVAQPLQWVLELEWQLASVHAARVVSLDRALGAGLAHDDYWEETQIWVAQWYSYWAAWLTYQLPQALTDLRVALEAVQYTCEITPADREAYMAGLLQNGMAPEDEQAYVDFGFPVARLPEAYAFLIDTEMLEPADVTYSPGVLDDPIMVQGIYDYANQLQQYAFTPAFHGAPPQ